MPDEYTVRVHFIDGSERIVPAKNIRHVGEEGARSGIAIVNGREIPIYNRVEWGFLWQEQLTDEQAEAVLARSRGSEDSARQWWQESAAEFADGFSETKGLRLSNEGLNDLLLILNQAVLDCTEKIRVAPDGETEKIWEGHRGIARRWIHQLSQQIGK